MKTNVKIEVGSIYIRDLEEGDLIRTHEWLHRPDLVDAMGVKVPFSLEGQQKWFEKLVDNDKAVFAVCDKESGAHIGNVSLDVDMRHSHAMASIFLAESNSRNKGIGSDAMQALLKYAFENLKLHRVYLKCTADRPQLVHFYTKNGFSIEGRLREHEIKLGKFVDKLMLGIFNPNVKFPDTINRGNESDIQIQRVGDWSGYRLYILREDLLPVACGGNKARIAKALMDDATQKDRNAIVAYGSSRSNLCRVLAMMCKRVNWPCFIVSTGATDDETTNSRIVKLCGAEVITCEKGPMVADTIDACMQRLRDGGFRPYYIFGDRTGHGNESVLMSPYKTVACQIADWSNNNGIHFNRIALAVGTGSTFAGLKSGFNKTNYETQMVGFTIAHPADECRRRVMMFPDVSDDFEISGTALCGGYAQSCKELDDFVRNCIGDFNVLFDSTYAGKALWGLTRYIAENQISGENILFVHTGSYPLAVDTLAKL